MTTVYDVARMAGVSTATVSRVMRAGCQQLTWHVGNPRSRTLWTLSRGLSSRGTSTPNRKLAIANRALDALDVWMQEGKLGAA